MKGWCSPVLPMVLKVVVVVVVEGSGPPSDFVSRLNRLQYTDNNYYLVSRDGVSASLDDLQRGHDGLIVKLNEVIKTLKEDELKLNNIFYKLGRHDTNLEGADSHIHRLTGSTRQIEAKLNKHAYNVDFLRRQVEVIQRQRVDVGVQMEVAAIRTITDRLDDTLTHALTRLGLLENTTNTLQKRSPQVHSEVMKADERSPQSPLGVIKAAERPPTLTVYPQPSREWCDLDYERVGHDCYWFGINELTFTEATAACTGHGGSLLTLPAPGLQLNLLLARLNEDMVYWTGGTDAFRHGYWVYLMTAQPVMPLHWVEGNTTTTPPHHHNHHHHCAGLNARGLIERACVERNPYVCQAV